MDVSTLDEESKALLRRIVERTAYRQLMAANIRGHGMKYLPEVDEKTSLARDLEDSLQVLREVERLYAVLGGGDLALAVRDQMEKIPYPYSRLELAVCLALCDRTERIVADTYLSSRSKEMAAIARTLLALERGSTKRLELLFVEFCKEAGNRAAAQQLFNRWLAITLVAFGRPNTQGDQRALALKLRTKRVIDSLHTYLAEVKTFADACGLSLPNPSTLGIDLPSDLLATAAR
jgi:hypothetical protein